MKNAANIGLKTGSQVIESPAPGSGNGTSQAGPTLSAEARPRNRGWFKPGNTAGVGPQLYTDRDLQNLQAEVDAFLTQSVTDDGGESEIGARRKSLHTYRARVHRRIVQLDNALELRGLFDKRGKLRVAWVTKLETLIGTAKALDNLLGLSRRSKSVQTLDDYLETQAGAESTS